MRFDTVEIVKADGVDYEVAGDWDIDGLELQRIRIPGTEANLIDTLDPDIVWELGLDAAQVSAWKSYRGIE